MRLRPLKSLSLSAVIAVQVFAGQLALAADYAVRASVLGSAGRVESASGDDKSVRADQQTLRLMAENVFESGEWALHVKTRRVHTDGFVVGDPLPTELFRYHSLSDDWIDNSGADHGVRVGYELDRASVEYNIGDLSVSLGRQPVDWGAGRFWQPLNIFGAFKPTDLDTEFKSGIDGILANWYVSPFSTLTASYILSPHDDAGAEDSAALMYRSQVGDISELSLLASRLRENHVLGAAFESGLGGVGWRLEAAYYDISSSWARQSDAFLVVGGLDYQFGNGLLIAAEWSHNSYGGNSADDLINDFAAPAQLPGLTEQLGQNIFGVSLSQDLTPLLRGQYLMLGSVLDDEGQDMSFSSLHQIRLSYSVGDESELLLSGAYGTGKGLHASGAPQSEYGHTPLSFTLRFQHYF